MSNNMFPNMQTPQATQPNFDRGGVYLESLVFIDVGLYNQPYTRPYSIHFKTDDYNMLETLLGDNPNLNKDLSFLPTYMPNLIEPQFNPESQIAIVNGWDNRRLRFVLIVRTTNNFGVEEKHIIQGYTDKSDLSYSNLFDPRMLMVVNSFTTLFINKVTTPFGVNETESVKDNYQIPNTPISGNFWDSGVKAPGADMHTLRPTDIFNQGIINQYTQGGGDVVDYSSRAMFGNITNNRGNNVPVNYLGKLLANYDTAQGDADMMRVNSGAFESASAQSREQPLTMNTFFKYLSSSLSGGGHINSVSSFTLSDLTSAFPNLDANTQYVQNQTNNPSTYSEYWNSAMMETQTAYIIANAIPSIALECLLLGGSFTATNMNVLMPGDNVVFSSISRALTTANIEPFANKFINLFKNTVAPSISKNGMMPYTIEVIFDVTKDTDINVSLNGQPYYKFVLPSFCDSILNPIITTNRMTKDTILHDFMCLSDTVQDVRRATRPIQPFSVGTL